MTYIMKVIFWGMGSQGNGCPSLMGHVQSQQLKELDEKILKLVNGARQSETFGRKKDQKAGAQGNTKAVASNL